MVLVVGAISCLDIFFDYNSNDNFFSGDEMTNIFNPICWPDHGQTIYTRPWPTVKGEIWPGNNVN